MLLVVFFTTGFLIFNVFSFQIRAPVALLERRENFSRLEASSSEQQSSPKNRDDDESDWLTSEFTLLNMPTEPSPELSPETVAIACARSLQWVDHPTPNEGLVRVFPFMTWECRKVVTARQGGDTVERFCQYGLLSPALQPFMGAYRIDVGNVTMTPARPPMRGALASFPIIIQGASVLALQHPSGMNRTGGISTPPETRMVMRLEKQRRPPLQDCWLVRELLDIRHAFAGDMGNAHVGG